MEHRPNQRGTSTSINRIKVKCKFGMIWTCISANCVLIESKWNVNQDNQALYREALSVLIESKWNVNWYPRASVAILPFVLIESKWNVNTCALLRS